jgi:hypothetical protein
MINQNQQNYSSYLIYKMKTYQFVFSTILLTTFLSCNTKIKSNQQFAYTIDKKGVYLYALTNNTPKEIYTTDKIFINDYFKQINDSVLQVGHQSKMRKEEKEKKVYSKYLYRADGDSVFITNNPPYTITENYDYVTDSIYHININTAKSYLYSVVDYEHYEHLSLKIKTRNFNQDGKVIAEKDTAYVCAGTLTTSEGVKFGGLARYYGESEIVLSKKIVTVSGDLILEQGKQRTTLLKYDGNFDPKFGSGYYNPTLTTDSKKVVFQYLAGFLQNGSCIYEMNIDTKNKTKLIGEGYFNPIYSPDNKLLLLFAEKNLLKSSTDGSDIYVFDIASKTKTRIGQGKNYLWITHK